MDDRRKRLLYIASHRGTKEADIFIGAFARARLADFTDAEVAEFEVIAELPCSDLMDWIMGKTELPAEHDGPVMRQLLAFDLPDVTDR